MSEQDYQEFLKRADKHFRDERKRLVKIIVTQGMVIVILFTIAAIYASYQLRLLKAQVASSAPPQIISREVSPEQIEKLRLYLMPKDGHDGENGHNGQDGSNGTNGTNGSNGENVTPEMVYAAAKAIIETNPEQFKGNDGVDGAQGPAGRTVFIRQNPLTFLWECKFSTDITWLPLAECGE